MKRPTFESICNIAAAVRCLNAGLTFEQIAESARKKNPKIEASTVRAWVRSGGFVKVGEKYIQR